MSDPTCNLLITSAGRRSYLVRYFKRALAGKGLVHAGNSHPLCPAFAVADKTVVTPLIYDDDYIPFLLDYCQAHHIRAVLSVFDVDLAVLAAHRQRFWDIGVTPVVSSPEVLAVCNDKWAAASFLREHGFLAPRTALGEDDALAKVALGEFAFPLMVKPRWGMGSIALYQAANAEELRVLAALARRDIAASYLKYESSVDMENCVLVQEKLNGTEYGLDVVNDMDGAYQATLVKRKLAMRAGETDSAVTEDNPALRELGQRLAAALGHVGNMDVDVFATPAGPVVLDMNARIGGGYPFSHLAGADLPSAIIGWVQGRPADPALFRMAYGVTGQKDIAMLRLPD